MSSSGHLRTNGQSVRRGCVFNPERLASRLLAEIALGLSRYAYTMHTDLLFPRP